MKTCYSCKTTNKNFQNSYSKKWKVSQVWPNQFSCADCSIKKVQCLSCFKLGPTSEFSKDNLAICENCKGAGVLKDNQQLKLLGDFIYRFFRTQLGVKFVRHTKLLLVDYKDLHDVKQCLGRCTCQKRSNQNGPKFIPEKISIINDLPISLAEVVLVHELTHAYLWQLQNLRQYNVNYVDEEEFCDSVAMVYTQWRIKQLQGILKIKRDAVEQKRIIKMIEEFKFRMRCLLKIKSYKETDHYSQRQSNNIMEYSTLINKYGPSFNIKMVNSLNKGDMFIESMTITS